VTPKQEEIRRVCYVKKDLFKPDDIVISLQPNSPQITGQDLDNAINLFQFSGKKELISVNPDLMQNGAFRIMYFDHALNWKDLSVDIVCFSKYLSDVHTDQDVNLLENTFKKHPREYI
jgi:hypothetical protein